MCVDTDIRMTAHRALGLVEVQVNYMLRCHLCGLGKVEPIVQVEMLLDPSYDTEGFNIDKQHGVRNRWDNRLLNE